nr:MAG TPA: hypothetical protein [Caudoviricetes sp.]
MQWAKQRPPETCFQTVFCYFNLYEFSINLV